MSESQAADVGGTVDSIGTDDRDTICAVAAVRAVVIVLLVSVFEVQVDKIERDHRRNEGREHAQETN